MVNALRTLRPATLSEVREAVCDPACRHLLIRGAGTADDWGGVPGPVDAVLDTTGLNGLLAYNPADMTVAVQAGMPLSRLQEVLGERGQRVALDAARVPLGATVGGLLATADAGPSRHAHGSLRDLVIGTTVVLADGTIARSGGHVIKNVAGYDLGKLFHGSLGTLGVVAETVLRLHPLPPAGRTLAVPCTPGDGFTLAGKIMIAGLEPTAAEWCSGRLLVRFEGSAAGAERRARAAARLAGAEAGLCEEDGDRSIWQQIAEVSTGAPGDTVFRAGTLPTHFPWLAGRLDELAVADGVTATAASSIGVGVHTVRLRGGGPEAHARLLATVRTEIAGRGGTTTLCRRVDGVDERVPAWGPAPSALPVLRAVKQRFDPGDRLGPGRFAPWM